MNRKTGSLILLVLALSAAATRSAEAAYIDPNTGGMLFQLLAVIFAFLSGIVLVFSSFIKRGAYRVSRMLRGKRPASQQEDQPEG